MESKRDVSKMTFKELAVLSKEQLSKQPPLTYEQMKASVEQVQAWSKEERRKQKRKGKG
jgi:hypothetical protein